MARRKMDFEALIAKGEGKGPDGFRAQTVNGTADWRGTGWNWQGPDYKEPEVPVHGAWQGGRNNRTAE